MQIFEKNEVIYVTKTSFDYMKANILGHGTNLLVILSGVICLRQSQCAF